MTDDGRINGGPRTARAQPVEQAEQTRRSQSGPIPPGPNRAGHAPPPTFADLLRERQGVVAPPAAPGQTNPDTLRFSAHAQTRLQSRHIDLQPAHIQRLQSAVGRAAGKGSKDSLVLMDDMAFVVSVTNRTVVTVVDKDNLKQNVFTNIDSAVIA